MKKSASGRGGVSVGGGGLVGGFGQSQGLSVHSSATAPTVLAWLVGLGAAVTLAGILMSLFQSQQVQMMMSTAAEETGAEAARMTPFLCSITRVRDEHIKFQSFVRHQLREGFDRVLILDDRSEPSLIAEDPRVEIMRVDLSLIPEQRKREGKPYLPPNKANIPFIRSIIEERLMDCTWVAFVDVDEFITTRRNEERTTRDEMLLSFSNFDAVHVPWIFYGNALDPNVRVEEDVSQEVLWRWNHSKHHDGSQGKTRDRFFEIGTCERHKQRMRPPPPS